MCRSISGRIFSWYLPGAPIRSRKSRAGSTPVSACPPEVIRPSCSIFVEWACGALEAHLRVGLDDEAAVPVAGLGIPPGQDDVEVLAVEGGVEDPEVLAELLPLTRERLPDFLLGETVHLDVDVHRIHRCSPDAGEQPVANGAADDEWPAAGSPKGVQDFTGFRGQLDQVRDELAGRAQREVAFGVGVLGVLPAGRNAPRLARRKRGGCLGHANLCAAGPRLALLLGPVPASAGFESLPLGQGNHREAAVDVGVLDDVPAIGACPCDGPVAAGVQRLRGLVRSGFNV